jgi:hypothetical protein
MSEDELKVTVIPASAFQLMPAAPGLCPECAVDHPPEAPHNAQSLYYRVKFHRHTGRWPTWADALAHCTPEVALIWERELRKAGAWTEPGEEVAGA